MGSYRQSFWSNEVLHNVAPFHQAYVSPILQKINTSRLWMQILNIMLLYLEFAEDYSFFNG